MATYRYVRDTETGIIYAIAPSEISEVPFSQTYTSHGQQVGADVAGDSVSFLDTPAAKKFCKKTFGVFPEYVCANENWDGYQAAIAELEEGTDYFLHQLTVLCHEYHDGHNYQSLQLSDIGGEHLRYELLCERDDAEEIAALENAIENRTGGEENNGILSYSAPSGYTIEQSRWQGSIGVFQIGKN